MTGNRSLPMFAAGLFGVAVLAVVAWAQDVPAPDKDPPPEKSVADRAERVTRGLDLNRAQQERIEKVLRDRSAKVDELRRRQRGPERGTKEAVDTIMAEEQDPRDVRRRATRRDVPRERERGEFGHRGPGGRFGGFGPMARLRGMDLTDDQRAKIQDIIRSSPPENRREAIAKVLTDEQKERVRSQRGFEPGRRGRVAGPDAVPFQGRLGPAAERKGEIGERFRARRAGRWEAFRGRLGPERRGELRERFRSRREGPRGAFRDRPSREGRGELRERFRGRREGPRGTFRDRPSREGRAELRERFRGGREGPRGAFRDRLSREGRAELRERFRGRREGPRGAFRGRLGPDQTEELRSLRDSRRQWRGGPR